MIYKWNLVKPEIFKEVFDSFWNKKDTTKNLVLELQNFMKDYTDADQGLSPVRIFFGQGIKFMDWVKYNEDAYDMIKRTNECLSRIAGSPIDICKEAILSMCMTDDGPKITPLRTKSEHDELIFKGMIDDDIDSIVDDKCRTLTMLSQSFIQPRIFKTKSGVLKSKGKGQPYVRIRAIEVNDWKDNISYYAENKTFKTEFIKDDITI